jgi:hypothetical protein
VDCSKVSYLLSEYVDDQLDPEGKKLVEQHLASCERCTAELGSLQAYLRTMAAVEKIRAPQGFLAAVHERIEEPSMFERITRWLFHPLRVKLPMELGGIALTALLLVFAYHQGPRQEAEKAQPNLSGEVRQSLASKDKNEALVDNAARTGPDQPVLHSRNIQIALLLPRSMVIEGAAEKVRPLDAPASTPKRPQHPLTMAPEQTAPPQPLPSKENVPSASTGRGRKDEPSAPQVPGQVIRFVKESAHTMGGALLSVEYDKGTNEPRSTVVRIPAASYSLFLEKLGRAGQIKETGRGPVEVKGATEGNEWLEIRIDLIQSD